MLSLNILGKGGHGKTIFDACQKTRYCTIQNVEDYVFEERLSNASADLDEKWILGFGDLKQRRQKITQSLQKIKFATIIHPSACISPTSKISDVGTFIGAHAYVGPDVIIGNHCIINNHASIEHDCVVEENVHVSVNATLCGGVHVDQDTFIGAGAVITPKIKIGSEVFIGAGVKVDVDMMTNGSFYNGKKMVLRSSEESKAMTKQIEWCAKKPIGIDFVEEMLQQSKKTNHFTNNGPVVKELENFIKNHFQIEKEVHVTASGTAALHALVASINIQQNRQLRFATQAFTFPSAVLGPLKDSIIVDNSKKFLGPSLSALEEIKDNIDGIIVTNVFGCICDLEVYRTWCTKNAKLLLLDNAATPMGFIQNNNICDIADAAIISFHETKFFGRGEGGAVICSKELWPYVNRAINFGFCFGDAVRKYHIESSNWRMSDFSAAFILSYLNHLFFSSPKGIEKFFHLSKETKYIIERTNNNSVFSLLFRYPERTIFSGICIRCKYPLSSEQVASLAQQSNIELKKYYVPLDSRQNVPVAWEFYDHVICFPFHSQLCKEDVFWMMEDIKKRIKTLRRSVEF